MAPFLSLTRETQVLDLTSRATAPTARVVDHGYIEAITAPIALVFRRFLPAFSRLESSNMPRFLKFSLSSLDRSGNSDAMIRISCLALGFLLWISPPVPSLADESPGGTVCSRPCLLQLLDAPNPIGKSTLVWKLDCFVVDRGIVLSIIPK